MINLCLCDQHDQFKYLVWHPLQPYPIQLQEGPGLPQSAGDVNPDGGPGNRRRGISVRDPCPATRGCPDQLCLGLLVDHGIHGTARAAREIPKLLDRVGG